MRKAGKIKQVRAIWMAMSVAVLTATSTPEALWADADISTAETPGQDTAAAESESQAADSQAADQTNSQENGSEAVSSVVFDANGGMYADGSTRKTLSGSAWTDLSGTVTYGQSGGETVQDAPLFSQGDIATDMTLRYVIVSWTDQTDGAAVSLKEDGAASPFFVSSGNSQSGQTVTAGIPLVTAAPSSSDGVAGCAITYHALYAEGTDDASYEAPVRDGYVLEGWFADSDGTTPWDGSEAAGTVYANWTAAPSESEAVSTASSEPSPSSQTPALDSEPAATPSSQTPAPDSEPAATVTPAPDNTPAATPTPAASVPSTVTPGSGTGGAGATDVPAVSSVPIVTSEPSSVSESSASSAADVPTPTPSAPIATYKVEHQLMDADGKHYTLKDTETLSASAGATVRPRVHTYSGFISPGAQSALVQADGSTVVTYRYARQTYQYTLNTTEHASFSGSTPSGTYYYGASIRMRCTPDAGYTFLKWSNGDTSTSTSMTMPAGDVVISPVIQPTDYMITYDLQGGQADNPDSYTVTSPSITLTAPTRNGYRFVGWTGSNGQTPQVSVTIPTGSTGDLAYTAVWENTVSVSTASGVGTAASSAVSSSSSSAGTAARNGALGSVQTSDAGEMPLSITTVLCLAAIAMLSFAAGRSTKGVIKKEDHKRGESKQEKTKQEPHGEA